MDQLGLNIGCILIHKRATVKSWSCQTFCKILTFDVALHQGRSLSLNCLLKSKGLSDQLRSKNGRMSIDWRRKRENFDVFSNPIWTILDCNESIKITHLWRRWHQGRALSLNWFPTPAWKVKSTKIGCMSIWTEDENGGILKLSLFRFLTFHFALHQGSALSLNIFPAPCSK